VLVGVCAAGVGLFLGWLTAPLIDGPPQSYELGIGRGWVEANLLERGGAVGFSATARKTPRLKSSLSRDTTME
jgi:hypothetical protein